MSQTRAVFALLCAFERFARGAAVPLSRALGRSLRALRERSVSPRSANLPSLTRFCEHGTSRRPRLSPARAPGRGAATSGAGRGAARRLGRPGGGEQGTAGGGAGCAGGSGAPWLRARGAYGDRSAAQPPRAARSPQLGRAPGAAAGR